MHTPEPSASDIIQRRAPQADAIVVYDGDCPFCSNYIGLTKLKNNVGSIELLNARKDHTIHKELLDTGIDLDTGMALLYKGEVFYGPDCLNMLARLSEGSNAFNLATKLAFSIRQISRIAYPFLAFGRNYTLSIMGRGTIGKSDSKNNENTVLIFTLALISIYALTNAFYILFNNQGMRLPAGAYLTNSSVILAMTETPSYLAMSLLLSLPPIVLWKYTSWEKLAIPKAFRSIPLAVAMMITWFIITSEPNYWSGYNRHLDHLVLIFLTIGLFFHPAFVGIYLVLTLSLFNELNYPIGRFWISEKGAALDQLIVLYAFLILRPGFTRNTFHIYFLFSVLVHIQNYAWAGIQKMEIGEHAWDWALYNHTANLSLSSILKGWTTISPTSILPTIELLNKHIYVANITVILFQILSLFVFIRKEFFLAIFLFTAVFHLAVFVTTGILFWEWAMLSLIMEYLVYRDLKRRSLDRLFNWRVASLSVALLLSTPYWHKPHYLGWFDPPVTNAIQFQAVMDDGRIVNIDDNDFNPYDRRFNYDRDFLFFTEDRIIADFPYENIRLLRKVGSIDEYMNLQSRIGYVFFDENKIKEFEDFARRFIRRKNHDSFISIVPSAPRHLLRHSGYPRLSLDDFSHVHSIRVRYSQWLFLNGELHHTINKIVHEFPITPSSGS